VSQCIPKDADGRGFRSGVSLFVMRSKDAEKNSWSSGAKVQEQKGMIDDH
jgi:hypothetical protein